MSNLTRYEEVLLNLLKTNSGQIVFHDELHRALYGPTPGPSSNVLQVLIGRLRRKGHSVKAARNKGYFYVLPPESATVPVNDSVEADIEQST